MSIASLSTSPQMAAAETGAPVAGVLSREKLVFADYLRFTGAMAVVLSHSAASVEKEFGHIPLHEWWTANIICSILHWGVCGFLMLSGMLLLKGNPEEDLGVFLRKRMKRVLYPFLGWAVVYAVYNYIQFYFGWRTFAPGEVWTMVLTGQPHYHMWFMSVIIALYLITPVLRVLVANAPKQVLTYFLVLWFVARLGQYVYRDLFVLGKMELIGFVGCYILGYYLYRYGLENKRLWYGLGILSAIITAVGTWYLRTYGGAGVNPELFYDSLAPTSVLKGMAIFLFFQSGDWKSVSERRPKWHRFVVHCASISYGIYLAHILFIEGLIYWYKGHGFSISGHCFIAYPVPPIVGIPLLALAAATCSIAVVSLWKRIPFLNQFAA